jgi:hypothetical protein
MGWRAENAVMVLGAILIGTFGAVLLSPGQLLLGSGALALSEAADAVRHDRAQPAFGANSMSSGFSVRGSYRGTPTFTLDGVAAWRMATRGTWLSLRGGRRHVGPDALVQMGHATARPT